MRKYILVLLTIFALALFTGVAAAQSSSSSSNSSNNNASSSTSSDSSMQNGSTTNQNGTATDQTGATTGQKNEQSPTGSLNTANSANSSSKSTMADNTDANKTVDGCIVKEKTDYFIQPASGERERLSGSQDLASHVGHHVRVEGTEQSAMASNSGSNPSGSSDTNTTASNDRSSTSGTASSETQNNANGSIAGNAGSSNATGTSASSSDNNWSGKDLLVTRVDMVSESCPADIQSKIDQNKQK